MDTSHHSYPQAKQDGPGELFVILGQPQLTDTRMSLHIEAFSGKLTQDIIMEDLRVASSHGEETQTTCFKMCNTCTHVLQDVQSLFLELSGQSRSDMRPLSVRTQAYQQLKQACEGMRFCGVSGSRSVR